MARDDWLVQVRKGSVELCLLALLDERERYGYEIVQQLNSGGGIIIAEGSIYPLLKRMVKRGLMTSTWRDSPGGPPRKYYRLTREGQKHLRVIAEQWRGFSEFMDGLLGGVR